MHQVCAYLSYYLHAHNEFLGDWVKDEFDGNGTIYFADDGSKYMGEIKENLMHGYGKFTTTSGDVFEG